MHLVLVAVNLRSTHNVGSLFRLADCLGIEKIYLCGYTPYPALNDKDPRLPHIVRKISKDIHKTALGAEKTVVWHQYEDPQDCIRDLRKQNYTIAALEQSAKSVELTTYSSPNSLALLLGNEVDGLDENTLAVCDNIIEIPMQGTKESLNVSTAAAIAAFWLLHQ